ncbi:MAG: PAS domain S-box protein, partial [Leptospiraceae bacterium]|nr:PAS domain S-box protein [Leptospiraceae bacterium]
LLITKPLESLQKQVELVESGNLDYTFKSTRSDEISSISKAFAKLVSSIKSYRNNLNELVQGQTAEINRQKGELENKQNAILNVMEDVKEQKRVTEQIADSLKKFKEAVDNTSDQIIITDPKGLILYANSAIENIAGYTSVEVIGKTPALWGKVMGDNFYKKLWNRIEVEKKPFRGEVKNRRKNGELYDVDSQIFPILDNNGEVKFYVGIERDITKEKEIDRMKTEFVSVASHQLRTPLAAAKWLVELLLTEDADNLTDKQKHMLSQVYESNERLIKLVEDLLNVTRIEKGEKFSIERKDEDLVPLINEVLESSKVLAEKEHIIIDDPEGMPEHLTLNVDSIKIKQVFNNLITNAIRYSEAGGHVKLIVEEQDDEVLFKVQDQGIGISSEQLPHIFKKFFRTDKAQKMHTEGTGLGLYISQSIVEGHGGRIWVESVEGKGSTFRFALPKNK